MIAAAAIAAAAALTAALQASTPVVAPPVERMGPNPIDPRCRYTTPEQIPRDAKGEIIRSTAARAAFIRTAPCPSTGQVSGACPGWSVDHVIPLAVGGVDAPVNMQWLPQTIKSCAEQPGMQCKDRFERRIYRCTP